MEIKQIKENNDAEKIIKERDLEKRIFIFGVKIIKFLRKIKYCKENEVVKYQLAKAATSVGANYEEAQGAFSKEDFTYKINICFKESKESNFWLRIISETEIISRSDKDLLFLLNESEQLKRIFGSIMKKIHKQYNDIENLKKHIQAFQLQELNRKRNRNNLANIKTRTYLEPAEQYGGFIAQ